MIHQTELKCCSSTVYTTKCNSFNNSSPLALDWQTKYSLKTHELPLLQSYTKDIRKNQTEF